MSNRWALLLLPLCRLALADSVPDSRVLHADRLIAEGHFTEAASEYQAAYVAAKLNGDSPDRLANAAGSLGAVFVLLDRYPEAEARLNEAVAIDERQFGPDAPQTARHSLTLAKLYTLQNRLPEAERILSSVRPVLERANGADSKIMGSLYNALGLLCEVSGKPDAAVDHYRRAVDIYTHLGEHDEGILGMVMVNLASVLVDTDRLPEAAETASRALRLLEQHYGRDHLFTVRAMNGLGWVYQSQRHPEEARVLYERALSVLSGKPGVGLLDAASIEASLGGVYMDLGYYSKAETILRQALATRERVLGPGAPEIPGVLNNLGALYARQKRWTDAARELERGAEIARIQNLPTMKVVPIWTNLAVVYFYDGKYRKDRYPKAEALFRRILAAQEERYGPDHVEVAIALMNLAQACAAQKQYREARQLEGRAVAIRQAVLGPQHPDTIQARRLYTLMLHKNE